MARVNVFTLMSQSVNNMGTGMNPKVLALAIEVLKRAYHEGINIKYTAGYRSYATQNAIYAQGRTKPGNIVTNARGGYSVHNFGLAADFVLVNESNTKAIWTVNKDWRRVAAIAKSLGFEWGGDWRGFPDAPHIQITGGLSTAQLRAGRRPSIPDVPKRSYYGPGDKGTETKLYQGRLQALGYAIEIDGYYGPAMEQSVRSFQKATNRHVDGLIGPDTKRGLLAASAKTGFEVAEALKGAEEDMNIDEIYADLTSRGGDVTSSHAATWQRAQELGITNGSKPRALPTKEQVGTMIVRAYEKAVDDAAQMIAAEIASIFAADREVSASHVEGWDFVTDNKLMTGRPGAALAREQLATVLKRYDDMKEEEARTGDDSAE